VRVPAVSVVDYALAVRAARGRHFDLASRLFDRVGEHARAERMRRAGRLYEAAAAPGATPDARLEWARFLAGHQERLFTHGYAWWGLQRYMLLTRYDSPLPDTYFDTQLSMLQPEERHRLETRERDFRDAQEERWQAYLVARRVAGEPASTTATVRAALRLAIDCLDRINTDRFGRAREIDRDRATLVVRLRSVR
jgi:hypothetical protein